MSCYILYVSHYVYESLPQSLTTFLPGYGSYSCNTSCRKKSVSFPLNTISDIYCFNIMTLGSYVAFILTQIFLAHFLPPQHSY